MWKNGQNEAEHSPWMLLLTGKTVPRSVLLVGSGDRKISAKISKTQQMLINILSKQATSEKINFWFRLSVLLKFVRYTSCGYVVITGLAVV